MSILGMNLSLKETTFGGEVNFLDSQQVRYVRGGVTIDAATVAAVDIDGKQRKILKAGTVLGKITASGKFGPYSDAASDGREVAKCILAETVEVTDGDAVTTAIDHARVIEARITGIDANGKTDLKDITFV